MDKLLKYFRDVQGLLQQQAESGEGDKEIILQNAFSEIDGYEFRLACHHDGSIVLEELLASGASSHQLAVFLDRLKSGNVYERLLKHRYGSHVIETAVAKFVEKGDYESETFDGTALLKEFFAQVASNEDLPYDTFASKALRKIFVALAASSLSSKDQLMGDIQAAVLKFDLNSLSRDSCGTLYLQDCIQSFDHDFVNTLTSNLPLYGLCVDKNGSRIVESILLKTTILKKIWKECFKGQVRELYVHRTGNFVLQKLISVADTKILDSIIGELEEIEGGLWQHPGVLLKLCETKAASQKKIYKLVTKGLEEPVMAIATLKGDRSFKPLGCQILSSLLSFDDACIKPLFDFFYDRLTPELFVQMALDKHASRTLQTLLALIKSPQKFVKKGTGFFSRLAVDPNGSHVLEMLFDRGSIEDKQVIANELKEKRKMVMEGSKYGSIVWSKLRMEEFVHNRERWLSFGEQLHKRKELFKDILEDEVSTPAKKHKK